ncbi:FkbM family methyltransferase [Variovorax sp. GT1P44]|uniref:FkbM family methyltransferase n=1 Tax=Variovorax sp. GT1P44 TaxID=3443742 RepID=UPI003F45EB36
MTERAEKTLPVLIGDRTFDVTSDDIYLDNLNGVFEPDSVTLFRTLVNPDALALDVGANIGCTGLLLSTLAKKVICFEPSPTTFALLEKNIRAGTSGNVQVVNAGLGRTNEDLELVFHPSNRSGGFVTTQHLPGHTVEKIKILQGDTFIAGAGLAQPVGFIKIDVEGFELDVVAGLAQTIATHKPVVTLELNHWCLNAFRRMSVPDFIDALRAVFPVLYAVDADEAKNLHDPSETYHAMHEHIVRFKFPAIVGAFSEDQIPDFMARYVLKSPRYLRMEQQNAEMARQMAQLRSEADSAEQRRQTAEEAVRSAESAVDAAKASVRATQAEISAIKASKIWRATAPLRALRRRFS